MPKIIWAEKYFKKIIRPKIEKNTYLLTPEPVVRLFCCMKTVFGQLSPSTGTSTITKMKKIFKNQNYVNSCNAFCNA